MAEPHQSPSSRMEDGVSQGREEMDQHLRTAQVALTKAAEGNQKSDSWPEVFAKKLRQDERRLVKQLEDAKKNIERDRSHFETQFRALIQSAFTPLNAEDHIVSADEPAPVRPTATEEHVLFRISTTYVDESKSLLQEYKKLSSHQIESPSLGHVQRFFANDKATASAAIEAGANVTRADIEDLMADTYNEVSGKTKPTGDEEALGRGLLGHSAHSGASRGRWEDAARQTYEAVEKICSAAAE